MFENIKGPFDLDNAQGNRTKKGNEKCAEEVKVYTAVKAAHLESFFPPAKILLGGEL